MQFKQLHGHCIQGLTVQLEYFDRMVVLTNQVAFGSHPHLTRITIWVNGSSRSVMVTRLQHWSLSLLCVADESVKEDILGTCEGWRILMIGFLS